MTIAILILYLLLQLIILYFVLMSGTPGVGKTTISRLLAAELGAVHYEIGDIARTFGALVGKDETRDSYIVDVDKISKHLEKTNQPTVIDGHIILKLPRKRIRRVIVLRCNPTALAVRLEKKKFAIKKIVENVLAEATDVCLLEALHSYGGERVFELDTTDKDIEACVKELAQAVRRGTSRVGICDWLSGLQRKRLNYLEAGKLWPTL